MNDKLSLAHELGAIASGEAYTSKRTSVPDDMARASDRFAAGLVSLIDERVAAAAKPAWKVSEAAAQMRALAHGESDDTLKERERAAGICERMVIVGRAWTEKQAIAADALFAAAKNIRAGHVEPHEPDGNERLATAEELAAPVAVGDTFLRLKPYHDWKGGEIGTVGRIFGDGLCLRGPEWTAPVPDADEIAAGDWQRFPTGYALPPAMAWHAATVRLIEAYRASLADPETGLKGAHECMQAMARMAGLEVPA